MGHKEKTIAVTLLSLIVLAIKFHESSRGIPPWESTQAARAERPLHESSQGVPPCDVPGRDALVTKPGPTNVCSEGDRIQIDDLSNLPREVGEYLHSYKFILIGERVHGTSEIPRFAVGLTQLLSTTSKRIIFAVEVWQSEQQAFDLFMSTGNEEILVNSRFFRQEPQYGVSSKAMFDLLKELRRIPNISIYCFDPVDPKTWDFKFDISLEVSNKRDYLMAKNLVEEYTKNPDALFIVLSGGLHASLSEVKLAAHTLLPMGYNLYSMKNSPLSIKDIFSIESKYQSGTAWSGISMDGSSPVNYGIHPLPNVTEECSKDTAEYYFLPYNKFQNGYTGAFFSRKLTASPPLNPTHDR